MTHVDVVVSVTNHEAAQMNMSKRETKVQHQHEEPAKEIYVREIDVVRSAVHLHK